VESELQKIDPELVSVYEQYLGCKKGCAP